MYYLTQNEVPQALKIAFNKETIYLSDVLNAYGVNVLITCLNAVDRYAREYLEVCQISGNRYLTAARKLEEIKKVLNFH
jgi:hypothetical protein